MNNLFALWRYLIFIGLFTDDETHSATKRVAQKQTLSVRTLAPLDG
jgi:hypothetical protein